MPTYSSYSGAIANKLDEYRALGRKEASHHRPPTDAAHPDTNEAALRAEAEKWFANEQKLFDSDLSSALAEATQIEQKAIQIRTSADQLLGEEPLATGIQADLAAERSALVNVIEQRMRAETDWRYFRESNGITQQAVYPESRVWHFGLVAVLAFIETMVNAVFYENAQGLLGGFVVALGVAVVNMGCALILGSGFRYKNLRDLDKKSLGWGSLLLFLCACLYFNTLFAAFRSEYQMLSDPSDPNQLRHAFTVASQAALAVFRLKLHLPDLWSFILFGVGILLSALAFWKGYSLDDRHPGYGELDRALKKARALEDGAASRCREAINQRFGSQMQKYQTVLREPMALVSSIASRIAVMEQSKSTLVASSSSIRRDHRLVLEAYRSANLAVRTTDPPAYFRHVPEWRELDTSGANAVTEKLAQLRQEIQRQREQYQGPLNSRLKELQSEQSQVLTSMYPEFVRQLGVDAQAEINRLTPTVERVT